MSSQSESGVVRCYVYKCHLPVDIILTSRDGQTLGAHKSNLANFSGGFPRHESFQSSEEAGHGKIERVDMPESGQSLLYLLQMMHHAPQPDLSSLPISDLAELAEAAEKYVVYHVIAICKLYMEQQVKLAPVLVLAYAIKRGHKDLADAAAYRAIEVYDDVNAFIKEAYKSELPEKDIIRWVRYRSRFTDASEAMFKYSLYQDSPDCKEWPPFVQKILTLIGKSPIKIIQFDKIVSNYRNSTGGSGLCGLCMEHVDKWVAYVRSQIPDENSGYSSISEQW